MKVSIYHQATLLTRNRQYFCPHVMLSLIILLSSATSIMSAEILSFYDRGNREFVMGNYEKALDIYQQAQADVLNSGWQDDALYLIGVCHDKLGDWGRAEETLLRVEMEFPLSDVRDNALFYLGRHYSVEISQKNWSRAAFFFQRIVDDYKEGDQYADALMLLGECYMNLKRWERAVEVFQTVIETRPPEEVPHEVHFYLAEIHRNNKNPRRDLDRALTKYEYILKNYPDATKSPKVYFALANCYRDKEKYEQAIDNYSVVVEKYPNSIFSAVAKSMINTCFEKKQDQMKQAIWKILQQGTQQPPPPSEHAIGLIAQLQQKSGAKITFTSDSVIHDLNSEVITYQGNVNIVNGDITLYSDKAQFHKDKKEISALGQVKLVKDDELELTGDNILYHVGTNKLEISGNARFQRHGELEIVASKLYCNLDSGEVRR